MPIHTSRSSVEAARSPSSGCRVALLAFAPLLAVLACSDSVGPTELDGCDAPQTGAWTHLGLEGEWVTSLAETPWGLFAGTGTSGVFRCDPASGRWQAVGLDHAAAASMLYVPGPTPRLLVGMRSRAEETTAAAVFATEDAGRTWLPWDDGLAERHGNRQWAYSLAMDPGDPQRLFMGQAGGAVRTSTDGGRSWRYLSGDHQSWGGGTYAIVVSPRRDGRMWYGAESALLFGFVGFSDDWGETWGWEFVPRGVDNAVLALAVDQDDPARLWAGVIGGVMRSEDHGRSWEPVLTLPGSVQSLLSDGGRLYAIGGTFRPFPDPLSDLVVYRSDDGGTSWTEPAVPTNSAGANVAIMDSEGRIVLGGASEPRGGVWRFQP